ncbi:metallophosphoesterase [uncultured Roseibium sp.]|uniref:metallophosphoesterase n=1 Tax=uncultured Roseibium sp. TaxID=1936171 RepID=UPI00321664B0
MRGYTLVALLTLMSVAAAALPVLAQVPVASIPALPKGPGPGTPLLAAWTQFVNVSSQDRRAAANIQARFVVMGDLGDCNAYVAKSPAGQSVAASLRGHLHGFRPANDDGFAVTVCVTDIPKTWDKVYLEHIDGGLLTVYPSGQDAVLPGPAALSAATARSGVVMGDTGCRGKYGRPGSRTYQDCRTDWPFPKVVTDALGDKPAFVLHVGDYHYFFEDDGTFWNEDDGRDRFEYWLQEFLIPAQPLLMSAPWVLGRGNHERCDPHRWFGEGWHVLFSSAAKATYGPSDRPCYDPDPSGNHWVEPSWAIDFGSGNDPWRIVVIDSNQPWLARSGFLEAMELTTSFKGDALWLSHYPPVKMIYYRSDPDYGDADIKADAADAMDCGAPYACRPRLVFAGHQHLYQRITWKDPTVAKRLPQIVIAGNGGTGVDANGLPGYAHGSNANPSISCTQTFPDKLPGSNAPFGFGSDEEAAMRTASRNGYVHIQRNPNAPGPIGWMVTPKWIGTPPAFPNANVHCDGMPVR